MARMQETLNALTERLESMDKSEMRQRTIHGKKDDKHQDGSEEEETDASPRGEASPEDKEPKTFL